MQQAQKGRGREQRGDSSRTFFAWVIVCFLTILSLLISSFNRPGLLVRLLPLGSFDAIDWYRLSVKNFAKPLHCIFFPTLDIRSTILHNNSLSFKKWYCIQGGRSWQPFVGSKNGNENFRQARIYNFRVKCVVFCAQSQICKINSVKYAIYTM